MIIYIGYAGYATYTDNQVVSAIAGIILFIVHLLINYKTIGSLINMVKSMLKKENK